MVYYPNLTLNTGVALGPHKLQGCCFYERY